MSESIPSFEGAVAFAQDLIRIPGLSGDEEAVASRVLKEMTDLGMTNVRRDQVGNVIGVVRGAGSAPPILLNCHIDVVAEGDHADWDFPPFGGEIQDGVLHGRGAMDIKGPLALQTHVAASLKDIAAGDIIVAHTVYEERGGWGMAHLLENGEVDPAAVIVGESTHGDVAIGHRGRGEVEVVLRGLAGHASAPDRARNPLDLAPAAITALRALSQGLPSDPILGPSTAVVTSIEVRPESRNVIPDEVLLVLDWRVLPGDTEESLTRRVRTVLSEHLPKPPEGLSFDVRMARQEQSSYTGLSQRRQLFTPGFLMDPSDPVAVAAARAVGKRDGAGDATLRPWTFATDGGWSCGIHGIPTVGFAPGEERFAHTNRERLDLDEAAWAYARYPELINALFSVLA